VLIISTWRAFLSAIFQFATVYIFGFSVEIGHSITPLHRKHGLVLHTEQGTHMVWEKPNGQTHGLQDLCHLAGRTPSPVGADVGTFKFLVFGN
jgi:hypothetical protein